MLTQVPVPLLLAAYVARCGELVAQVVSAPPDASVVRLVDDISDEVGQCCAQWQVGC
jgi:hypothetical protein